MKRSEIIELKSSQLKEEVGLAMSSDECKSFVAGVLNLYLDEFKNLNLHFVSNSVARCEHCQCKLTLVRLGKYQCDNPDCSDNDC